MNKWATYWVLHCIGFAGLMATLFALRYQFLPAGVMGSIGGAWMGGCICFARWLVTRSKTPNVLVTGACAE